MKHNKGFRKSEVKDNPLLGDGVFALGVMTGLVLVILAYLGQHIWGSLLTKSELINLVPAMAAFMIALVSLLISFRALIEQKKMRQAGVDPVLVAHLAQDPAHPLVVTLNISNVGAGAAMNVFARIVGEVSSNPSRMLKEITTSDFFNKKRPMAVVLQNQSIPHWMGTGPELMGKNPVHPFTVELQYQDIEGATYHSVHPINIDEFNGRTSNEPAQIKMWRELEKIRKLMER